MKANIRIRDLEFRTCNGALLSDEPHTTGEIVRWQGGYDEEPTCYTLALWRRIESDFELRYVGRRPFDCEDDIAFCTLARVGQSVLDALLGCLPEVL